MPESTQRLIHTGLSTNWSKGSISESLLTVPQADLVVYTAQVIVTATFVHVVRQFGWNFFFRNIYIYICTISAEMEDSEPATCIMGTELTSYIFWNLPLEAIEITKKTIRK